MTRRPSRHRHPDHPGSAGDPPVMDPRIGWCSICRHGRMVESSRGSRFWRCARSDDDPRYPKYPRLPVLACEGYEAPTGNR